MLPKREGMQLNYETTNVLKKNLEIPIKNKF